MRLFEIRLMRLLAIFCAIAVLINAEAKNPKSKCNFDAYRPLRFGTPIRGWHEELATERVVPTYPAEALQKGIQGRVEVHILINRAGDVIKTCGVGERTLARSAEEAVSKWKFQRDFGFTFAGKSHIEPKYAILILFLDFEPTSGQILLHTTSPADYWECAEKYRSAADERGVPNWLSSETLMRLHGEVRLELLIDEQGKVTCVRVVSGHPIAISSAMAALPTWRFKPFTRLGKRMPVLGNLIVPYNIAR